MRTNNVFRFSKARPGRRVVHRVGRRVLEGTLALGLVFVAWGGALGAAADKSGTVTVNVGQGSSIWFEGNSTLHHYSAWAKSFSVSFQVAPLKAGEGIDVQSLVQRKRVSGLTVDVAWNQMDSGDGDLNDNMLDAVNASAHPDIVFTLSGYTLSDPTDANAAWTVDLKGQLSMNGVTRPVELQAQAYRIEKGGLEVKGELDLLMTDYGISPPSMALGSITCDNDIAAKFDVNVTN
jgi:hypothetical protein